MLFPPLNEQLIRAVLSPASAAALQKLSLLDQTNSTNEVLLQMPTAERHAYAVLADQQTAGRGRRGRRWQSPAGSNIYLSLGWNFSLPASELACLSLAVGVAVVLGLERCELEGLGLKWPNDVQLAGKKLGGILLESRIGEAGASSVVAGIGVNVCMPAQSIEAEAIDQPWANIAGLNNDPGDMGLRDRIAGHLLDQLVAGFIQFESSGFEAFRQHWSRLDVLRGKNITVRSGEQVLQGQAQGIDQQGNLLLAESHPDGSHSVRSLNVGEVSVRLD